jgi:hypothetical protein
MQQPSRRQFLAQALAAGAGATVLEPFARPAAALAQGRASTSATADPDRPDPNFFYGKVVDAGTDGTLKGVDEFGAAQDLLLTSSSWIWREGLVNNSLPTVGEQLSARGVRQADGSLAIDRCWANIVKMDGHVVSRGPGSAVVVDTDKQGPVKFAFKDLTTVVDPGGKAIAGGSPANLVTSGDVTVIGWETPGGGFHASRVIMASEGPTVNAARKDVTRKLPRAHAAFTVQYAGVSSWFSCNGAACGTCHTSSMQIAWPKMSGGLCGPSNGCPLPSNFPAHSCSACFLVQDACQTTQLQVKVADCGPNTRCRTTGCKQYQDVWFDLTRSAFSFLGGNLDLGFMDLWVSAAYNC